MSEPLKLTTLKNFIKERTGLRLEGAAAELLAEKMTEKIERVVDRAAVLVELQEKSTLQVQDMDRAYTELEESSAAGQEPKEVFETVDEYELGELGELIGLLEASLEG